MATPDYTQLSDEEIERLTPDEKRQAREALQAEEEEIDRDLAKPLDKELGIYTARELQGQAFDDAIWVVPDLVPEGCTLLCGPSKRGKSWLALQMVLAVATGGYFLGKVQVEQGEALYLALEDNKRRIQDRMDVLYGDDEPWPDGFYCVHSWQKDDLASLEAWIKAHPKARLVVIDVFAQWRMPTATARGNIYQQDYDSMKPIAELANELHVAIVVVHHDNKMKLEGGDDPFLKISGTNGLIGAADNGIILARREDSPTGTLYFRGRDVAEASKVIRWTDQAWTLEGDIRRIPKHPERGDILAAVVVISADKGFATPKDIAQVTSLPYDSVKHLMRKMLVAGDLEQIGYGKYVRDRVNTVNGVNAPLAQVEGGHQGGNGGADLDGSLSPSFTSFTLGPVSIPTEGSISEQSERRREVSNNNTKISDISPGSS